MPATHNIPQQGHGARICPATGHGTVLPGAPARNRTRLVARLVGLVSAVWLAACDPGAMDGATQGPALEGAVPVALLVPGGSGQASDDLLARSLENAARLAIADLNGVQVDLRVYSTAGQPAQAVAAAVQAADDGARIIIGPVFAGETNAVGVAMAQRGLNVMSFSNNPTIAGGNVFVLGPTFQNTADRLVRYAAAQGRQRLMIVHDRTTAGNLGRDAITRAAAGTRAAIAATGSYDFSQEGVMAAVPGLAAQARGASADAVFFTADTAGALPLITQLLAENGVDPAATRFVGLTRWDVPATTLTLPGIQGGWFALPDPGLSQQFAARYSAAYGEAPHPIAGLAYDGIAAIGALARNGGQDPLGARAITQGSGFAGVNGIFRLRADGSNERGLAVAQIRNNEVAVIDPAPRAFGGPGF